ncbi:MAG: O-antigen ligase family protein [Rhodococcus sp.]|nr:O-antigen ligase family protein [Rhodococcus sp. (in: high G+C Gram-positive bacteria)]MBJ7323343.1 O-antigen ligase family protein [Rhodococcus sp. (in: high G+C Gram-positive bacteria)]
MIENLLLLFAGAASYFLAAEVVYRWPPAGLALVFGVLTLSWHIPNWTPFASIFGLSLNVADFVAAVLFSSAILNFTRSASLGPSVNMALQLFIFTLAISAVRGISNLGLASPLNELRPWIYILCVTTWTYAVMKSNTNAVGWFETWLICCGIAVSTVGLINTAIYGFGGATSSQKDVGGAILEAGRPISSGQAVAVAAAAVICLWKWHTSRNKWHLSLAVVFALVVLLAQHRSVWIAAAASILVTIFFLKTSQRISTLAILATVVLCGWIVLLYFEESQAVQIFSSSAEDSRTYDGRVYDWRVLIENSFAGGPHTVLFGAPSGSGWLRYREDGLRIGYIPHNWFVATYLRVGVIGLTAMFAVVVSLIARGWKSRSNSPVLAVIVLVCVYCWAYNLQWYLAPIIGWIFYSFMLIKHGYEETVGRPLESQSAKTRKFA